MSGTRGMNGSAHGRDSLAAKRERYESESAETSDPHRGNPSDKVEKTVPPTRPETGRAKD